MSREIPPIYSRVALDIASKIARGELAEGQRLSGRSLTSSEYGVSPETVRRAFRLLADMEIVDVQHNSGAVVVSRANATEYMKRFKERSDVGLLRKRLRELVEQRNAIDRQIVEIMDEIVDMNERFSTSDPMRSYEIEISAESPLIGKTIADSKFWQNTGATIVAIRRGEEIIQSPGPYAVFLPHDSLIIAGDVGVPDRIKRFIDAPAVHKDQGLV